MCTIVSCKYKNSNDNVVLPKIDLTIEKKLISDSIRKDKNLVQKQDSIYRGVEFYCLTDFNGYLFKEIEPYEEFLVDDSNNMYNLIVYEKENTEYTVLALLEENIGMGELSEEWKKTKKTIVDYVKYSKGYRKCWYHSFNNEDDIECCLFVIQDTVNKKFRSWRIDYDKKELVPLVKSIDFECY